MTPSFRNKSINENGLEGREHSADIFNVFERSHSYTIIAFTCLKYISQCVVLGRTSQNPLDFILSVTEASSSCVAVQKPCAERRFTSAASLIREVALMSVGPERKETVASHSKV